MIDEALSVGIVVLAVLSVKWLENQQTPWIRTVLNWFPAILFAYVIPALFTHLLDLHLGEVFLHVLSRDWIIPFAIATVMSALPFEQLKVVGFKPIMVFVAGSFFIATLPVVLVFIFSELNEGYKELFVMREYWKGLVPIVGGWIGGSTSQLVLKEVIDTEEGLFLSILVLDNILVNIWTILMFQFIQRTPQLNRLLRVNQEIRPIHDKQGSAGRKMKPLVVVVTIFAMVLIAHGLGLSFLWKVIALSIVGLLLVNLLPIWNVTFVLRLGGVLIVLIMAILGLRLDFSNLSLPLPMVVLVVIWLLLHYVLMLVVAVLMRVNLVWVPIASMANLGGISTAPAVTAAYRKDLMPHAILLAILSMVSGTAWGLVTIYLFGLIS
ncbi:MAG: DUF819 family protein [Bacteroidota bacterium]